MNIRAPISAFDTPSPASRGDLSLLHGELVPGLGAALADLLACRQELALTDSASSRRATNARHWAEARSNHCASSTTHTTGLSPAMSEEHRETNEKAIRDRAGAQPERRQKSVALRNGKTLEAIECGRAQLMKRSERKLHLRLDPDRTQNSQIRR